MLKTGLYVPGFRCSTLTTSASIISASNSKVPLSWERLGSWGPQEDALPWLAFGHVYCECRSTKCNITQQHKVQRGASTGNGHPQSVHLKADTNLGHKYCSWTTLQAKQAPSIQPKFQQVQVPHMPPKFRPSVVWNLGWKVPRTFHAILVAMWGSGWLPKLPSGFPRVVPSRI